MPRLQLPDGSLIVYESAGDGFPLVLLPDPKGIAAWSPHVPLLSELCHVMAYECCQSQPAAECLAAFLDVLRLERVYLASPVPAWVAALQFACHRPEALEALLLVDLPGSAAEAPPLDPTLATRLASLALPAFILLADGEGPARSTADWLSTQLPHCRTMTPPVHDQTDLPKTPHRQFPHLMMRFLLDRERHRNLVRGASFLL